MVRGDATVKDAPCAGGLCLELSDGAFRGTPVGTGAYSGRVELKLAEAFPNGEGGAVRADPRRHRARRGLA